MEKQIQENIFNNNSIVAKLTYKGFSMLFTGDIEAIAEKEILKEYKNTKKGIDNMNYKIIENEDYNLMLSKIDKYQNVVKQIDIIAGIRYNIKGKKCCGISK